MISVADMKREQASKEQTRTYIFSTPVTSLNFFPDFLPEKAGRRANSGANGNQLSKPVSKVFSLMKERGNGDLKGGDYFVPDQTKKLSTKNILSIVR